MGKRQRWIRVEQLTYILENNKKKIHGETGHSGESRDVLNFFIEAFPCYLQYQMLKLKTEFINSAVP